MLRRLFQITVVLQGLLTKLLPNDIHDSQLLDLIGLMKELMKMITDLLPFFKS